MGWTWIKQKLGLQLSDGTENMVQKDTEAVFSHPLDEMCAKYGAVYLRTVFSPQEVQIMLVRSDATLSATGPTTAEAVEALAVKAEKCWGTL